MRCLLDSHTLIWAVDDPSRLGPLATKSLKDSANVLLVSAASIWEIAIKTGLGKLSLSIPYREWMSRAIADLDAVILPINVDYAALQAELPAHHGDPFDRLLVAQATVERLVVVSNDSAFDSYGIQRVW